MATNQQLWTGASVRGATWHTGPAISLTPILIHFRPVLTHTQRPKFLNQEKIFLRRRNVILAKRSRIKSLDILVLSFSTYREREWYYFILQDSVGLPWEYLHVICPLLVGSLPYLPSTHLKVKHKQVCKEGGRLLGKTSSNRRQQLLCHPCPPLDFKCFSLQSHC